LREAHIRQDNGSACRRQAIAQHFFKTLRPQAFTDKHEAAYTRLVLLPGLSLLKFQKIAYRLNDHSVIAALNGDDALDSVDPFRLKQQEAREPMAQLQLIESLVEPKAERNEIALLVAKMRLDRRRARGCIHGHPAAVAENFVYGISPPGSREYLGKRIKGQQYRPDLIDQGRLADICFGDEDDITEGDLARSLLCLPQLIFDQARIDQADDALQGKIAAQRE